MNSNTNLKYKASKVFDGKPVKGVVEVSKNEVRITYRSKGLKNILYGTSASQYYGSITDARRDGWIIDYDESPIWVKILLALMAALSVAALIALFSYPWRL